MDMSGSDGPTGLSYADHDVQVIGFKITNDDQRFASLESNQQYDPVRKGGIDNNEVAELVGFYRYVNLTTQGEVANDETAVGSAKAEHAMGINLSSEVENPTAGFTVSPTAEREDLGNDDSSDVTVFNDDEPGVLDWASITSNPGVTGPGIGSPGVDGFEYRDVDLRARFGEGPYVDATDEISIDGEVDKFEVSSQCDLEVTYGLYWNVSTVEGRRRPLARP